MLLVVLALSAAVVMAQIAQPIPPVRHPGLGPVGHGFGSVVFPGTGVPRGNPVPQGHIQALGATVRGVPQAPYPGHYAATAPYIYPVAIPYGYGMAPAPAPAPNVTVINAPAPPPTVIINQGYVPERGKPVAETPTVHSYQAPIPNNPEGQRIRRETDDRPTVYLLALHDGTVYSCYAFWLEGEMVYYVTTKQVHKKIPKSSVDIRLSEQLNRERNVEFELN